MYKVERASGVACAPADAPRRSTRNYARSRRRTPSSATFRWRAPPSLGVAATDTHARARARTSSAIANDAAPAPDAATAAAAADADSDDVAALLNDNDGGGDALLADADIESDAPPSARTRAS